MLKNKNSKRIWKWADLQIIGVAMKSFLSKGKKTHNDIKLSDCAESLNLSANLFYKDLCDYLCERYAKNPSDTDRIYRQTKGEKAKRGEKGKAKFSFVNDLQEIYVAEFCDNIENAFVFNSNEKKTEKQREAAEQSKEEIRAAKQKKIDRINKRITELIEEREQLQKDIENL